MMASTSDVPVEVQKVGLLRTFMSYAWVPFQFFSGPIINVIMRFWPDVLPFLKGLISTENTIFRNYGSSRKIGKAGKIKSTTKFRSGVALPKLPDLPDLANTSGTLFCNLGDAQVIDTCEDITTTTTFG